jgi:hypothetical protein
VCIGAYRCLSLCMDPYRWVSVCIRAYRYVSLRIGTYRFVLVPIVVYRCVSMHTCTVSLLRIGAYGLVSVGISPYGLQSVCNVQPYRGYRCIASYENVSVPVSNCVWYRCCVSVCMDPYWWVPVRIGYSRCVTVRIGVYQSVCIGAYPTVVYRCISAYCGVSVYQCIVERIGAYLGPYQSLEVCGVGA